MSSLDDMIVATTASMAEKPSLIESILSAVDTIFTSHNRLQKTRLSNRNIRGIAKTVAIQTFLRTRLQRTYKPFLAPDSGEFTDSPVDNRILTAVCDAVITSKISLQGKSRDEIIKLFQTLQTVQADQEKQNGGILRRYDY